MSEFSDLSKAAYTAISEGDVEAFIALADPDVEFNSIVEAKSYRGHDGIREWWDRVIKNLGGVDLSLGEVVDKGDRGYVEFVIRGSGDVELPPSFWQAVKIENGKAVWWGIFGNEAEASKALESAG